MKKIMEKFATYKKLSTFAHQTFRMKNFSRNILSNSWWWCFKTHTG